MKKIELLDNIKQLIAEHGESTYPHECCGVLFGKIEAHQKTVREVRSLENANDDSPGNRYLIPPEEVLRSERYARENELDVVGFYHSHPDVPAKPSEFDLEHAWPSYSYIILGVEKGNADELYSWELNEDRSGFHQEEIVLERSLDPTTGGGN